MACETCINEERIKRLEDDSIRNTETHRKFYDQLEQCRTNDAVTGERYQTILTTMAEMKNDIAEMKGKPAKRWDAVILSLISGIVGILVGLVSLGVLGG